MQIHFILIINSLINKWGRQCTVRRQIVNFCQSIKLCLARGRLEDLFVGRSFWSVTAGWFESLRETLRNVVFYNLTHSLLWKVLHLKYLCEAKSRLSKWQHNLLVKLQGKSHLFLNEDRQHFDNRPRKMNWKLCVLLDTVLAFVVFWKFEGWYVDALGPEVGTKHLLRIFMRKFQTKTDWN